MRSTGWSFRVDDLIAFVTARLDEDEAAAKAATSGDWYATGEDILIRGRGPHWDGACVANASGADGEHVARHDPARALREVEAKRAILALHGNGNVPDSCSYCHDAWPCRTVRFLAAVYGDHMDQAAAVVPARTERKMP